METLIILDVVVLVLTASSFITVQLAARKMGHRESLLVFIYHMCLSLLMVSLVLTILMFAFYATLRPF